MSSRSVLTYGTWAGMAILALSQIVLIAVQVSRGSVQPVTVLLAAAVLVLVLVIIVATGLPAARRATRVTAKLNQRGDCRTIWVAWLDDGYRRELKKRLAASSRISVMAATNLGIELWLDDGDAPALVAPWEDIHTIATAPVLIGAVAVDGITIAATSPGQPGFLFALGAKRRGIHLKASDAQHRALITELIASWRAAKDNAE